jgi:hypothetical protein
MVVYSLDNTSNVARVAACQIKDRSRKPSVLPVPPLLLCPVLPIFLCYGKAYPANPTFVSPVISSVAVQKVQWALHYANQRMTIVVDSKNVSTFLVPLRKADIVS